MTKILVICLVLDLGLLWARDNIKLILYLQWLACAHSISSIFSE